MRDGHFLYTINQRLTTLRGEADTRRLLRRAGLGNLWARLLPVVRRLERWVEQHAGSPAGADASLRQAAAR